MNITLTSNEVNTHEEAIKKLLNRANQLLIRKLGIDNTGISISNEDIELVSDGGKDYMRIKEEKLGEVTRFATQKFRDSFLAEENNKKISYVNIERDLKKFKNLFYWGELRSFDLDDTQELQILIDEMEQYNFVEYQARKGEKDANLELDRLKNAIVTSAKELQDQIHTKGIRDSIIQSVIDNTLSIETISQAGINIDEIDGDDLESEAFAFLGFQDTADNLHRSLQQLQQRVPQNKPQQVEEIESIDILSIINKHKYAIIFIIGLFAVGLSQRDDSKNDKEPLDSKTPISKSLSGQITITSEMINHGLEEFYFGDPNTLKGIGKYIIPEINKLNTRTENLTDKVVKIFSDAVYTEIQKIDTRHPEYLKRPHILITDLRMDATGSYFNVRIAGTGQQTKLYIKSQ